MSSKPLSKRLVSSAISTALYGIAHNLMSEGDDWLLRALTVGGTRFTVESVSVLPDPFGKSKPRRRKFSNPCFLTPSGILHGFPSSDEDLFIGLDDAMEAIKKYGADSPGSWMRATVKLSSLLKSKRYLRWKSEVDSLPPGEVYSEPRRSLEESFLIFSNGGFSALNEHYTKSYSYYLLRRFKESGLIEVG